MAFGRGVPPRRCGKKTSMDMDVRRAETTAVAGQADSPFFRQALGQSKSCRGVKIEFELEP